jgi:hypothetical protein
MLPAGDRPTVMYLTSENDPDPRGVRAALGRRHAHDEAIRPGSLPALLRRKPASSDRRKSDDLEEAGSQ